MRFRLFYRGRLRATGSTKEEKQELRRKFHIQLKSLWFQKPLKGAFRAIPVRDKGELPKPDGFAIIKKVGAFSFCSLVCESLYAIADLDIIFLRPQEPGGIIIEGGDIDNRVKTLLDGLRMPKDGEIPKNDLPRKGENPFFCLLEDDALVTHLSVTTDRLLDFNDPKEVVLLITVTVRVTETTWDNVVLAG